MKNTTFDWDFENPSYDLEWFNRWEFASREIFRYVALCPNNDVSALINSAYSNIFSEKEFKVIDRIWEKWKNHIHKVCDKTYKIDDYVVSAWKILYNSNDGSFFCEQPRINYAGKIVNWDKDIERAKRGWAIIECEGTRIKINLASAVIVSKEIYKKTLEREIGCEELKLPQLI